MPAVHPSPDRLHDFLLGKLPDPEYAAVEAHLTACDECRAASAADTTADSLVELLAAAGRSGSATPLPAHTLSDVVPSSLAATREWTDPAADPFAPPGLADHPRYRLLRRLGMGGMGVAYLAEHRGLCRKMALKVIRPGLADRPGAAERFRRETRAVARLSHPNIVAAFDAEETGGAHFLVMEYVPGETLAELVAGGRPLPAAAACRAARDAARGLAHAHAAGLVHRDVKPSNLIRDRATGAVKVLDFGLAAAAAEGPDDGGTRAGVVVGTVDYIAPEQAGDPDRADPRADVYSLGCTLYHLLAGRPPFPGSGPAEKLDAHRTRTPDPIPGLPPGLSKVLGRMMAKNPADRFPTAAAVAEALEPFAVEAVPAAERPRVRRWLAAAAGLLALAAVVAAGAGLMDRVAVVRDKDGKEVARMTVPEGGKVDVEPRPAAGPPLEPFGRWDGHTGVVSDVALTPRGQAVSVDEAGRVLVRELPSGKVVRQFTTDADHWTGLAVSPDGATVALGAAEHTLRWYDLATGRQLGRAASPGGRVRGVAFTPDGKRVLAGEVDGARLWDLAGGDAVRAFDGAGLTAHWAALSPDGSRVLVAGGRADGSVHGGDGEVRVFDAATGRRAGTLTAPAAVVTHATFSPDGKRVAGAFGGGRAVVWEVATGKAVRSFPHPGWVERAVFTPDGRRLLTAFRDEGLTRGGVAAWELEADLPAAPAVLSGPPMVSLAVTADGRAVLVGGYTGGVQLRRLPGPPPAGEPVNLLGPGPKAGEVFRTEQTMTLTDGKLTVAADGETATGTITSTNETVDEDEVVAVADGWTTKSRTKVVTDRGTSTVTLGGETDTRPETGPLEGETVQFERDGDGWKKTLVGKEPTDKQAAELKLFPPPAGAAEFYPAEPVRPGHTWTVDLAKLLKRLELPAEVRVDGGSYRMTFVRVVEHDGEPCAEVAEEVELRATKKAADGESSVEIRATGTSLRSLRRGFCPSATLAGTMTETRTVTEDGRKTTLTTTGKLAVTSKTRRK